MHQMINYGFKILIMTTLFAVLQSCNLVNPSTSIKGSHVMKQGEASYYADKFQGKSTASGEKYNKRKFTAAHRTLPFGTMVQVTNLKNGKTVTVKINDRGPYKKSRIIDLSRAAARQIGLIKLGVTQVKISYQNPDDQ